MPGYKLIHAPVQARTAPVLVKKCASSYVSTRAINEACVGPVSALSFRVRVIYGSIWGENWCVSMRLPESKYCDIFVAYESIGDLNSKSE